VGTGSRSFETPHGTATATVASSPRPGAARRRRPLAATRCSGRPDRGAMSPIPIPWLARGSNARWRTSTSPHPHGSCATRTGRPHWCRAAPAGIRTPAALPTARSVGPPVSRTRSVAIDPAPFRGVLPLPISALKSAWPVLGNPANRNAPFVCPSIFRYAFADAVSEPEAQELYEAFAVERPFEGKRTMSGHAALRVFLIPRFVFDRALENKIGRHNEPLWQRLLDEAHFSVRSVRVHARETQACSGAPSADIPLA